MGSFSIWHWLLLLIFIGGPVLMIRSAKEPLERGAFVWRIVLALVVVAVTFVVQAVMTHKAGESAVVISLITFLIRLGAVFAIFRWVACRLLDRNKNPWGALLCFVPILNLLLIVYLGCVGSVKPQEVAKVFD